MTRTRLAFFGLLTLVAAGTGSAQAGTKAAAPDSARLAAARLLLASQGSVDALREAMDSEFVKQRLQNPRVPAVFYDSLIVRLDRVAPQLVDSIAVVYSREISLEDLKSLNTFFQSPVGQRYAKAQTPIQMETKEIAQRWGLRLAMAVMKDLVDEGLIKDLPSN